MSVFFINPFLGAVGGDFESIATVTVGSGGASSIEFTSIPGTYQHLQLRFAVTLSTGDRVMGLRVNGSSSTNDYAKHGLEGNGSSASAYGVAANNVTFLDIGFLGASSSYGLVGVCDILDYTDTAKNTTIRTFAGHDRNGAGQVSLYSGLYRQTTAITSLTMMLNTTGNYSQYSTAALYGIKAP